MLLIFFTFFLTVAASTTKDTLSPFESLRDGETMVSANGGFELGFFSSSKHRYLGVWYKENSSRTVIWVANRKTPLTGRSGILNITQAGTPFIIDKRNIVLWSPNTSRTARQPILQLLPSGNLVVTDRNNESNKLWQSFDYPSNTLLATMKLRANFGNGTGVSLSSWRTAQDPSPGNFTLSIDTQGFPQLVLRKGRAIHYRLGSWNGLCFTGTPDLIQASVQFKFEFVVNEREVYYTWESTNSLVSRLVLSESGQLNRFIRTSRNIWIQIYDAPVDECDYYSTCGAYSTCNINNQPKLCSCLHGFSPKSSKAWDMSKWNDGCIHTNKIACGTRNEFMRYPGLKLPDTSNSWYNRSMNLVDCREKCLANCSCTAYANSDIREGGRGCLLWFADLMDMREYSEGGQDLFVKVGKKSGTSMKTLAIIVGSGTFVTLILVGLLSYLRNQIQKKQAQGRREAEDDDMELPIFDIATITKATDDFSSENYLGQGGFGSVHKGKLKEGQEIAVKRLSANSGQGVIEFKNEVQLIAKLQHRNLVKLIGCCVQGEERMLIYEYMPNKSLDYFIFDQTKKILLDWQKRMNIIIGIARGLLYLHQDSRLRIIHRDLKASNVLLDYEMNPKISDFGLARLFSGDQTEANTDRVVGTYGYMPPEYAVDGIFSLKSDVYSYGVMVIEILSGKKNRGFQHPDHDHNLLGHAWKLWTEQRAEELTDKDYPVGEVMRCIHVGLLCVQQSPEDRPDMSSVVLMLGSDSALPQPKEPGFFTRRNMPHPVSETQSFINEVSITDLEGR